jgi:hypothetical protein
MPHVRLLADYEVCVTAVQTRDGRVVRVAHSGGDVDEGTDFEITHGPNVVCRRCEER